MSTQSDGKILLLLRGVGGDTSYWLLRLNANGSRDSSFGTNGIVLLNLRRLSRFTVVGFEILSDGRILIGGDINTNPMSTSGADVAWAAILDKQGNYDRRFGLQGIARLPFSQNIHVSKILSQPDGKVVLVGGARSQTNSRLLIVRLTGRGRLDTGFGLKGIVLAANVSPGSYDFANSATLMSDGRLVVVGSYAASDTSPANFLVARIGTSGIAESYAVSQFTPDQNSFAYDVAIQPDGKLVVAGYTRNPDASADGNLFAIARYTQ
jgi:uncharacterized delta-60 repeat protein